MSATAFQKMRREIEAKKRAIENGTPETIHGFPVNIKTQAEKHEGKKEGFSEQQITELRAKARAAKIRNWHSKTPGALIKELGSNK